MAAKVTKDTGVPLDAAVVFGVKSEPLHMWSASPILGMIRTFLGAIPRIKVKAVTTKPGSIWQQLLVLLGGRATAVEAGGGVHAYVSSFA
jgi:hypothetical protein